MVEETISHAIFFAVCISVPDNFVGAMMFSPSPLCSNCYRIHLCFLPFFSVFGG